MHNIKLLVTVIALNIVCLNASGVYHENTKITFVPDVEEVSDFFGYTVLLNRYGLLVGAPKAKSRENEKINPGQVYNCSLSNLEVHNTTCFPMGWIEPDYFRQRSRRFIPGDFFRDDMWFGATIAALSDGKILICAPRWAVPYQDLHLLANGVCYLHKHDKDGVLYVLKEQNRQAFLTDGKRKEYGEYGTHLNFFAYGQAGMSVAVTANNSVVIGAPGLMQWTGGVVNVHFNPSEDSMLVSRWPVTNPYFTKDLDPDDYFGYSVDSGVFEVDGKVLYVGGAPRSKSGYGQVLVFEPSIREQEPLNTYAKIKGPQLGSYFGASLCCVDIDRDGRSDLLVGAPNYVKKDGGLPYDQGAVFVYMARDRDTSFTLQESGIVSGSGESGARFGSTIAELGDIDGDGYTDVAIGAPWENEGVGAVYIYRGTNKGLRNQYVQKILAEGAKSFGISISRGLDVDHNNCNDLAVGAFNTRAVYLYRCVPTMQVQASIKVPDAMNLPANVTSFTALFCVSSPPQPQWPDVKMNINAKIIIDPEMNRAFINGASEYGIVITPGHDACDQQTVEVKPIADLSIPISIRFKLQPVELMEGNSTAFVTDAARLSEDSKLHSSFLIQLIRDCGEDMICTPWLVMTLEALEDPYVPGSSEKLGARLTVINKEEPAYGARVNITLPSTLRRVPSECNLEASLNATDPLHMLVCYIPAPLRRNEEISWEIELEYSFRGVAEVLPMNAILEDTLYSRNITDDAVKNVMIEVTPVAEFGVSGKPLPNATMAVTRDKLYNEEDIIFEHYYQITNYGPSDWSDLTVHVLLPDEISATTSNKNCNDSITVIQCIMSIPANVSVPLVIELKYNLSSYEEVFQQNTTHNITSEVLFYAMGEHRSANVTTSLALEPASPFWILFSIGLICGLIVLAAIISIMYKYGFFTRTKLEELKKLKEQNTSTDDVPGTSNTSFKDTDDSTHELIYEENSD